jgi:hypothetical protein
MILHWEVCPRFALEVHLDSMIIWAVAHMSELVLLLWPIPAAQVETNFANTFLYFYLNFVNDLNPGRSESLFP